MAAAQVALIYVPPLPALFEMTPLTGWTWLRIHTVAFTVFVIVEVEKTILRRRSQEFT